MTAAALLIWILRHSVINRDRCPTVGQQIQEDGARASAS